jgi:hypothetical protein
LYSEKLPELPMRVALALIYPGLFVVMAIEGGPHGMGAEWWNMPAVGLLSFFFWWVFWWGIIEGFIKIWRRRKRLVPPG